MKNWQRGSVGIEVFSGGVRFVKLARREEKLELVDFGEKTLERGLSALDRAADGFGPILSGARVKIAFLGQSSHTYRLPLPAELLAAGADQLKWELSQKLPSNADDYAFCTHTSAAGYFLGTAAHREPMEMLAMPFAKKGAADLSFSSAAFALGMLFSAVGWPAEGSSALLHLGEDYSTIVVRDRQELVYVGELPAPPGYLETSQGELAESRELLKKSLLERFGVELSTLLHLLGFRVTEGGKIDAVYLSGPGSGIGDLTNALGELGGVRVTRLALPGALFPAEETPERWAVPLGLALAGLGERSEWNTASELFSS